eukprot:CAMPEP_0194723870 /NCGR_PEP_ID=MMETSP0296-20130528/14825_1 /TAXON_ID=39354 /ORGANISM="Heterosigma akashiwo, Strain CCMP2393" /LENGTH=40 /DNA_ID= /DNA_START= /DNA_END= /DNA_ORIENTATION=
MAIPHSEEGVTRRVEAGEPVASPAYGSQGVFLDPVVNTLH